ncbi:hypothetical protein KY290_010687 [Solanum tuberosum]|uniref:Putative plant transposon protein domain-containing protein n=1 Tax=Solanum tuberosum TaxID=4113 RepID=A0ABQ7W0J5_SOLTU|nr:hypothetical protein KY290_010687 [Solanum tuberosum]
MAPKARYVVGSKWSRKGEASGFDNRVPAQKFRKKAVKAYGLLWLDCQREPKYMGDEYVDEIRLQTQFSAIYRTVAELGLKFIFDHPSDCNLSLVLNELLGTPNCDANKFNRLKETPLYRDIRHTLCGVDSTARWGRSKDTGRHNTLHFANFNLVARVWLKIVCSVLLLAKHLYEETRDRVVLVYMLMKGMPINVGAILRQHMMKFKNNMRWRFCYGELITHYLRSQGIEKEVVDMTIVFHPDLTGKLVYVTRTKTLDTSHGPVLSSQERQARDDSVMARMFRMVELQLRINGHPVTDAEMETMAERYPLFESAVFLCKIGPAFLEPLDDDETTAYEAMDDEEVDDVVESEANALMVFDGGDDEA